MSLGPDDLSVAGGVAGLGATYDDLRALADDHDALGDRLRGRVPGVLALAADADLLASAVLSPVTFAAAETALTTAVWGTDGLVAAATRWEVDAEAVRASVGLLVGADAAVAVGLDVLAHGVGRAAVPLLAAAVLPVGAGLTLAHLSGRLGTLPAVQSAVVARPGLVEPLVAVLSGAVDVVSGRVPPVPGAVGLPLPSDPPGATGVLAGAFAAEGTPGVVRRRDLESTVAPPRGVADLLGGLAGVAALADDPEGRGTVAVDTLVGADGRRAHVVHLPGTDDFSAPWAGDDDVRDLGADLGLLAGEPTTYGRGVAEAMRQAGVRPGEPVLLTGHSQGGMQAVALAAEAGTDAMPYDVRQVVTAGAPTAQVPGLPEQVAVLSLENRGDVVPLLDGAPNPDTRQRVTVTFDAPVAAGVAPGLAERHALGHHVDAARAVDASSEASLVAQTARMRELGLLDAAAVERHVFRITR
ncbi:hypothetical protein [Nocardioides sp. CFH 31398]|uniref:hypothetical protein n=1 Tax=Nocardioides sp. CFH 31398 TaxID=2919579 RepID=UPI001F06C47B|nr:hypothetical protein [Nocardioides sp. CFH 31398]MCH1868829.1 hypothetical protein [Nocardioides sp. CFH 31398]